MKKKVNQIITTYLPLPGATVWILYYPLRRISHQKPAALLKISLLQCCLYLWYASFIISQGLLFISVKAAFSLALWYKSFARPPVYCFVFIVSLYRASPLALMCARRYLFGTAGLWQVNGLSTLLDNSIHPLSPSPLSFFSSQLLPVKGFNRIHMRIHDDFWCRRSQGPLSWEMQVDERLSLRLVVSGHESCT